MIRRNVFLLLMMFLCASTLASAAPRAPSVVVEVKPQERRAILDASRPQAAAMAGQAVRFKVDRLNVDRGYAILVGELVGAPGKQIDWGWADSCHADLDKMLWVVLRKQRGSWNVLHMEICASEPPYWYMEQYGGLVWPCGVYAGLRAFAEETLEMACRRGDR